MKNFNHNWLANFLWVARSNDQHLVLQFIESTFNELTNQHINLSMSIYQTNSDEKSIQHLDSSNVFVNQTLNEFIFRGSTFKIVRSEDFTRLLGNGIWFTPSGDKFENFQTAITRHPFISLNYSQT